MSFSLTVFSSSSCPSEAPPLLNRLLCSGDFYPSHRQMVLMLPPQPRTPVELWSHTPALARPPPGGSRGLRLACPKHSSSPAALSLIVVRIWVTWVSHLTPPFLHCHIQTVPKPCWSELGMICKLVMCPLEIHQAAGNRGPDSGLNKQGFFSSHNKKSRGGLSWFCTQ